MGKSMHDIINAGIGSHLKNSVRKNGKGKGSGKKAGNKGANTFTFGSNRRQQPTFEGPKPQVAGKWRVENFREAFVPVKFEFAADSPCDSEVDEALGATTSLNLMRERSSSASSANSVGSKVPPSPKSPALQALQRMNSPMMTHLGALGLAGAGGASSSSSSSSALSPRTVLKAGVTAGNHGKATSSTPSSSSTGASSSSSTHPYALAIQNADTLGFIRALVGDSDPKNKKKKKNKTKKNKADAASASSELLDSLLDRAQARAFEHSGDEELREGITWVRTDEELEQLIAFAEEHANF